MSEFTFLDEEQIFGYTQLDILKKYGTKCAITDFSILLGGYVASGYYTSEGNSRKDRTGWWWTKSRYYNNDYQVCNITARGVNSAAFLHKRNNGARPALPYSSISSISSNRVRGSNGILEVEYGEYPQTIVSGDLAKNLERAYSNGRINQTGKSYTTDSVKFEDTDTPFQARTHIEYEYNGRKYIRFIGDSNCDGEVLSDGRRIQNGNIYWVEVKPIKWMIDEKANIALSKKIIFSGVQFDREEKYNGNFEETDIKKFMDNYFAKDIIPSYTRKITPEEKKQYEKRRNPYGFNFDTVSEEDIIKGAIESGTAVFLHGKSGDGKSARVKALDPNAIIMYLRTASLESLIGKSVYNSEKGEMIDIKPTWLKKLEDICTREPNKYHILFLDEITNAVPSIQGMAFNIVLDREVNGIWKLPDNARIVAAGNDMKDSLSANELAEPLFNRFAHVYIETPLDTWLKWAINNNIHPAIYAYISCRGEDVLRSEYNGEKPNADPRKWEMASKMLYAAGKPEMLRALVGEDITREFVSFCNQRVITIEDVLNENYTDTELNMNTSEIYLTVAALSRVDEINFEKVREFVSKLDKESCRVFDLLWTHGDETRLELLEELKLKEKIEEKNHIINIAKDVLNISNILNQNPTKIRKR